jgi:signal transduction histidine kinase
MNRPKIARVAGIVLATLALNTGIAVMVYVTKVSNSFASALVQSQIIGLSITALCWAVTPRVVRSKGALRVALPLFGVAILAGSIGGVWLAQEATAWLFPGRAPGLPGGAGGGPLSLQALAIALVLGMLGTITVYSLERLRDERLRVQAEERRVLVAERNAAQSQLQALRAQVEPHFLFNTLANVSALIDRDPPAARGMIDDVASHLRATLRHARAEATTLGEELDVTASLLAIMQRRMGERLDWRFEVPDALRALPVAPMLVQPLVENAVKHGIEPTTAGGSIAVRAALAADGALLLEVADTGRGQDAADRGSTVGTGTGLANLAERLRAIYGPQARLALRDNAPHGTIARLTLPPLPATQPPATQPPAS